MSKDLINILSIKMEQLYGHKTRVWVLLALLSLTVEIC